MLIKEEVKKKWQKLIESKEVAPIRDRYRAAVTAQLLENQQTYGGTKGTMLTEDAPLNHTGANIGTWDPILIALVRRSMPNLIAYDVCGVQPMSGPSGLIFAIKSKYASQSGSEALFAEANTSFSGSGTHNGSDPLGTYTTGTGVSTATGEALGDSASNAIPQMAFTIEKVTVTAIERALGAEYSIELAQDLKALHGLDADTELANILSAELLVELNREVVRKIYACAKAGAQKGTTTPGTFDLDTDSSGRWSVERWKGLLFAIEREANTIARETRRGKGNVLICSSDVASALAMSGMLDYTPAMKTDLTVDDTGNTFVGVINGRMKVYIDPYFESTTYDFACVGYKGQNPYDAGVFYCPYIPLQLFRAVDPKSFQPKLGFKTRYGLAANPFTSLSARSNIYYRILRVSNLLA